MPTRVMCVDDNESVAQSLERRLTMDKQFDWLGWLPTCAELIAKAGERRPDVVLLDIDIPGDDTFEAIQNLARRHPSARVLVLSGHVFSDYMDRAIAAGAWGYLSKSEETGLIIDAIRRVAAGEFVLGKDSLAAWGGGEA